jgi:hypothetical protein
MVEQGIGNPGMPADPGNAAINVGRIAGDSSNLLTKLTNKVTDIDGSHDKQRYDLY